MTNPASARSFAASHHQGQSYAGRPFIEHPAAVVGVLRRFGVTDDDLISAGWLHDVVEDTDITLDDIRLYFGSRIAELVDAVTDIEMEGNRSTRKRATYEKTLAYPDAIIIKLADRIANVEQCWADESALMGVYQKEMPLLCELWLPREKSSLEQRMWDYLFRLTD